MGAETRATQLTGRIHSVQVSDGGVPKRPVASADVSAAGLAGDRQRDLVHHGGNERAVCLLGLDVIEALASEGHPIAPGLAGENLTLAGIPWPTLGIGSRLYARVVRPGTVAAGDGVRVLAGEPA